MRIDILTVLPEMIEGMVNCSIVKRAQDKGLAEIHLHNLRDYTTNKWRRVDDYPFGGEAGMVMPVSYTHLDVYKRQLSSHLTHYRFCLPESYNRR